MIYKNNWVSWKFRNIPFGIKQSVNDEFDIEFSKQSNLKYEEFYKELLNNAVFVHEFEPKISLFFSGGLSSQIVLRTYLDLKLPVEVILLRYNKDYNLEEFTKAKKICENLKVQYKVIDFNIDTFFENEALDFFQKSYSLDPYKLVLLKASTYVDNTPIIINKFPYVYRDNYNYAEASCWNILFTEDDFVFQSFKDRPIIGDWFQYRPELILSLLKEPLVNDLINDKIRLKYSIHTIRVDLLKDYWNLINSFKFEFVGSKENYFIFPEPVLEFYKSNIATKIKKSKPIKMKIENFISEVFV